MRPEKRRLSASKQIAYAAIMCALLIGGQYVFSFISGVEIVTVLLVCFGFAAGVKLGVLCAVAFSLLRCFLFGFYPNVIVLYLLYYPALTAAFGALGNVKGETFERFPFGFAVAVNLLLFTLCGGCLAVYFTDALKVSRILKATLYALLWVIFSLGAALLTAFDALLIAKKKFGKNTAAALQIITFAGTAAVFTICFTLLDDLITPLMAGYTQAAWLAYFYASFAAMLPQTVCTVVTVALLFFPFTKILFRFFPRRG